MSVEAILKELQELQSSGDSVYPKGVFPSQRYHSLLPYKREDDNLFFTASILKILQGIETKLTIEERGIANSIIDCAKGAYSLFKNKDGLDTYNFWQTTPSRHFPNGLFMNRFKHFQIPDDVDDTALVYLTQGASKERVIWLRKKLKSHANLAYKRAFNPLPKYRDLKCYSTFFGEKMYIEFDVCVLSNLMSLILTHIPENELNEYDTSTLEFICSVIENNEHISAPFYSAPNYPTTALILYHVGRLIPLLPEKWTGRIEHKFKSDLESSILEANGHHNQLLLENTSLKLGLQVTTERQTKEDDFFFFHAGMITAFENSIAQKLADSSFFHLSYASKALNRALLIENMVLKRELTSQQEGYQST